MLPPSQGGQPIGLNVRNIDRNLQVIGRHTNSWGLPDLPVQTKVDLAANIHSEEVLDTFLGGLAGEFRKVEQKEPSPVEPIRVESPIRGASGFLARGGVLPEHTGFRAPEYSYTPTPPPMPGFHPSRPADIREQITTGLAGLTTTANLITGQRLPKVLNPYAAVDFQTLAKERGFLPPTFNANGQWGPESNQAHRAMAEEDAQRSIAGNRFGAASVEGFTHLLDTWLSPAFLGMVTLNVGKELVGDFVPQFGEIGAEFDDWADKWGRLGQEVNKGPANAWNIGRGIVDAMTGPIDDILMPIANIALLFTGVSEAWVFGRGLLLAGRALKTADNAYDTAKWMARQGRFLKQGDDAGEIARSAAITHSVASNANRSRFARYFKPGSYNDANALEELIQWQQTGRNMRRWKTGNRGLEQWRSMRTTLAMKKANQQIMRFGQTQLAAQASGMENKYTRMVDEQIAGLKENPTKYWFADVISIPVMPRNILPLNFIQKGNGSWAKRLTAQNADFMRQFRHGREHAEGLLYTMRQHPDQYPKAAADKFEKTMRRYGGNKAISEAMGGDDAAAVYIQHTLIHTGIQKMAVSDMNSYMGANPSATRADGHAIYLKARDKYMAQVAYFDPDDIEGFMRHIKWVYEEGSDEYLEWQEYIAAAMAVRQPKVVPAVKSMHVGPGVIGRTVPVPVSRAKEVKAVAEAKIHIASHNSQRREFFDDVLAVIAPGDVLEFTTKNAISPDHWEPYWDAMHEIDHWVGQGSQAATGKKLQMASDPLDLSPVHKVGPENLIPSVTKMVGPKGDQDLRRRLLGLLADGSIGDPSPMRDNAVFSILSGVPAKGKGRFALAKEDTIHKGEMLTLIAMVRTVRNNIDTLRELRNTGRGKMFGSILDQARTTATPLRDIKDHQWRAYVSSVLNQSGTYIDSDQVRHLAKFLDGYQNFDVDRVIRSLESQLGTLLDGPAFTDVIDIGIGVSGAKDVVKRADDYLFEAQRIANLTAAEVVNAPAELVAKLKARGYTLVHGTEYWAPGELMKALPDHEMVNTAEFYTRGGQFNPEWLRRKAFDFTRWVAEPREGRVRDLFRHELAGNMSKELRAIQGAGGDIKEIRNFDPVGKDIDRIIKAMYAQIKKGALSAQQALDDASGLMSKTGARFGHAFSQRDLRNAFTTSMLKDTEMALADGTMVPLAQVIGDDGVTAVNRALRESQWFGLKSEIHYRGALTIEDWLRSKGFISAVPAALFTTLNLTTTHTDAARFHKLKEVLSSPAGGMLMGAGAGSYLTYANDPASQADLGDYAMNAAVGAAVGGAAGLAAPHLNVGLGLAADEKVRLLSRGLGAGLGATAAQTAQSVAGVTPDETSGPIAGLIGGAAGALAGPYVGKLGSSLASGNSYMKVGRVRPFSRAYMAMPTRLMNLSSVIRFTLSPVFDLQRYTEGALLSNVKDLPPGFDIAGTAKTGLPMSKTRFIKKYGTPEWERAYNEFDAAGKALTGHDYGFEVAEASVRRFTDEGMLGWNPTHRMVTSFYELADQGMEPTKAYEAVVNAFTYGVEGRSAGELTLNAIFFPASFTLRMVGRTANFLQEDLTRAAIVHDALRTYYLLKENYNLDEWFEEHVPLARDLQKLNAYQFGIGPGQFGGIHRPWIDFFVPFGAKLMRTTKEGRPQDFFVNRAGDYQVPVEDLVSRMFPLIRDTRYLIQHMSDQKDVVFGESHLTPNAEADKAWELWRNHQGMLDVEAKRRGFANWHAFSKDPRAENFKANSSRYKAQLGYAYPAWEQRIADSRDDAFLAAKEMQRVKEAPRFDEPLDFALLSLTTFIESIQQRFATAGYDLSDQVSLPPEYFDHIRNEALRLANIHPGFDALYDRHFRRVYGPIETFMYTSLTPTNQVLTEA